MEQWAPSLTFHTEDDTVALVFLGKSRCPITGKVFDQEDEIAYFPPFSHPDPLVQTYSGAAVTFSAVRVRPEFQRLVNLYASLVVNEECLYKDESGAVVKRRFGQVEMLFFPLLLSISAPERSALHLAKSRFAEESLTRGQGRFEDFGVGLEYAAELLVVEFCPTKYFPSNASSNLIQHLNRRGKDHVVPFLQFLRRIVSKGKDG
jgi:hypothetical protein